MDLPTLTAFGRRRLVSDPSVPSYGKVYNIGHAAIKELFFEPVLVEEKVDGSQFSFGVYGGTLCCRSRGKQIDIHAPDNLFSSGVEMAIKVQGKVPDGWTFRCEYLKSPRHNALSYDRIPRNHLALFDIDTGLQNYVSPEVKAEWAETLDIDVVPVVLHDKVDSPDDLRELLELESFLGGQKIEGVVCKNYERFGRDGKAYMGKYVSEEFKEKHATGWKRDHPAGKDIKNELGDILRSERRWEKAIERLRDAGELQNAPQDIGPLIKSINLDIIEEEEEWIKAKLWNWARKDVIRMATRGFPQWYKERLLENQFMDATDKLLEEANEKV